MHQLHSRSRVTLASRAVAATTLAAAIIAGCSGGSAPTPTSSPSPTPAPRATSAQEFATAVCSSLTAMARAVGNPDTGGDSVLSAALDEAIRAGDTVQVERAARDIRVELESARGLAVVAGGWQPGAASASQLDRLMLAFEAMVEAKRAAASRGLAAADPVAQAAFLDAGGLDAWRALIGAGSLIPAEAGASLAGCRFWEGGAPSAVPSLTPVPASPAPSG